MRRSCGAVIVIGLAAPASADDAAVAQGLYEQAKTFVEKANYAEACPLFAASFKADQQLGVLLNLADCHEQIGKLASAWSEFRDALSRAQRTHDMREAYAQKRADALAPRVDHLKLVPPSPPIASLVVKLDDTDVSALVGVGDSPVDPGEHAVVATAADRAPWRTTVTIEGEGKTVTLQLEASAPAAAMEIVKTAPPPEAPRPPIKRGWSRVGAEVAVNLSMGETDPLQTNGSGQVAAQGFEGGLFARYELSNYLAFRPELSGVSQACGFDAPMMDNAASVSRVGAVVTAPIVLVLDRRLTQAQFFAGPELGVTHTEVTGQLAGTFNSFMFGGVVGFLLDVGPVSITLRLHHTFTGITPQSIPTALESFALGVGYGLKL